MKGNNLIVAGKDCQGCEHYIYGDDKRVYCKKKDKDKSFFYGQYITCDNIKDTTRRRRKKK